MRKNWMRAAAVFSAIAVLVAMVGCSDAGDGATPDPEAKGTIVVGSKIDVEGPVLGYIIAGALEDAGYTVTDRMRTGATDVVRKALLAGDIDIYPEYTANGLTVFHRDAGWDPAILKDADATFEEAKKLDEPDGVVWLAAAPANNTWAVAVPRTFAEQNSIETLADWAAYINGGGTVKIAGSQEFFDRADAFKAFEKEYGFTLKPEQKVALATGDTAVTEKAASDGTDGVNAAMAYGTDGTIAAYDLVVLGDPKGVQPIYQPAPTVRKEIADEFTDLGDILDPVFAKLDLETLQELNKQAAVDGTAPSEIAQEWLRAEGFIE